MYLFLQADTTHSGKPGHTVEMQTVQQLDILYGDLEAALRQHVWSPGSSPCQIFSHGTVAYTFSQKNAMKKVKKRTFVGVKSTISLSVFKYLVTYGFDTYRYKLAFLI